MSNCWCSEASATCYVAQQNRLATICSYIDVVFGVALPSNLKTRIGGFFCTCNVQRHIRKGRPQASFYRFMS